MSEIDVEWDVRIPRELLTSLTELTDREATKLLYRAGKRLTSEKGLIKAHWAARQGSWAPNTASTIARKKRMGLAGRVWVNEGDAHDAASGSKLDTPNTPSSGATLFARVNAKTRHLTLGIRKMVKGVNVYSIVQRGRFGGVKRGGKTFSAKQIADERSRHNAGQALSGGRAKYEEKGERISVKPRPLMEALPGDAERAWSIIENELHITLQKRGIV